MHREVTAVGEISIRVELQWGEGDTAFISLPYFWTFFFFFALQCTVLKLNFFGEGMTVTLQWREFFLNFFFFGYISIF